jgi:DNA-binding MarR family transcriptional regulator
VPACAAGGAVAALLAMDRTTLTANLKSLERRGLIEIAIDPADRRGRLLTLTKAGRRLLRSAVPIWERTHEQIERVLARTGADRLRAGLRALSDDAVDRSS